MKKETIKLNKYYQQIILACKGWNRVYSTRNTIERILSQYLGVDRKYIDQGHVYKCFDCKKDIKSVEKHCEECGVTLCEACYENGERGLCEECEYEFDGMC